MSPTSQLLSIDAALALVLEHAKALEDETVLVADTAGRVLGECKTQAGWFC
jgi:molybdopterin biosynthesis enzyme